MDLDFSEHAVDRYRERHCRPGVTRDAARTLLASLAAHTRLVPLTTNAGGQLAYVDGDNIYMVVVLEDPGKPRVLTVLAKDVLVHGMQTRFFSPEEIAALTPPDRGARVAAYRASMVVDPPSSQRPRPRRGVEIWSGRPGCPPTAPPAWLFEGDDAR